MLIIYYVSDIFHVAVDRLPFSMIIKDQSREGGNRMGVNK